MVGWLVGWLVCLSAAVAPIRKALGVRTSFNLLGPLLNSADASAVVIGVFEEPLLELLAGWVGEMMMS